MKFDLISDVHLDIALSDRTVEALVQQILPSTPQPLLVFAGDFGDYNEQNIAFLKELKKTYSTIFFIYGNNDLKLKTSNPEGFEDVYERVKAFEYEVSSLEGVYRLDENCRTFQGIVFGGSDIFYDFDEIMHHLHLEKKEIYEEWYKHHLHIKHRGWIHDPDAFAQLQKEKLRQFIPKADVIITHGAPNFFVGEKDEMIGFFRFEADEFIPYIENKVWCFGHQHRRMYAQKHGCTFINASYMGTRYPKIQTVSVSKTAKKQ